jgi:radical SAM superfamily enzyme YgiQ (UPF0313 family)
MKFLFIDPLGDIESTGLNMGIAYCSTRAIRAGHRVAVLDLVNFRVPDRSAAIRNAVERFGPDAVGFSVSNMSFNEARACVEAMRQYYKGAVVLGGPEISALGRKALELIGGADIAVIGEGEVTFVEMLGAMERKEGLGGVSGLVWRRGGEIVTNAPRDFIAQLDGIEFPDYGVFGVDRMDVYPIVTTRGCPYGCIFCFSHLGKKWRARSPENVIEELKVARTRYGARLFQICDPSFNVDIGRVERFCELLIKEKVDMPWVIQGFRADRVTERMMRMLKEARCRRIFVGVETLEEDVFRGINKGESLDDIKKSIALMKKYDMEIFGYMLMGLPGDTFKKTLRSFGNAQKLNLDLLAYASCVPFTGTGIEKWALKHAKVLSDSYDVSSLGTRYDSIAFHTDDFTLEERRKARRILNIKSGGYNEPNTHPLVFKFKRLLLILRYDFMNLPRRIRKSVRYRLNFKESVDSINLSRGVYFYRVPDGTWGLGRDERIGASSNKRVFLDIKRLTMSEVEARPEA